MVFLSLGSEDDLAGDRFNTGLGYISTGVGRSILYWLIGEIAYAPDRMYTFLKNS